MAAQASLGLAVEMAVWRLRRRLEAVGSWWCVLWFAPASVSARQTTVGRPVLWCRGRGLGVMPQPRRCV